MFEIAIIIVCAFFLLGAWALGRVYEMADERERQEATKERLREVWSRGRR